MTSLIAGICDNEPLTAFAYQSSINSLPTAEEVKARILEGLLPHQEKFCLNTESRKLGLVCGFGAGKTHALIAKLGMIAADNVGFVSAIFEPTNVMLRDVLYRSLIDLLDQWEIPFTYRASPMPECQLHFKEGNHTVLLRTILTYQRLRGQNLCAALFDEADTIPMGEATNAMNMALARLRSGNNQQFCAATTPEGYGWAFHTFDKEATEDTALIRARTMDNPYLPDTFIPSLQQNYSEQLIKAYLEGQFVNLTTGQVYDRFSRVIHVKDNLPDYSQEILKIGIDFNVDNTNAVVCVRDGNKLVIIDEIAKAHDTDALAQEIVRRYPDRKIQVFPDASGSQRSTNANASRTDISILQSYGFENMSPRANPAIKDRVQTLQNLLCNSKGESRLEVSSCCRRVIECLELQSWDEKTQQPDKLNGFDHMNDALGYCVYREFSILYARAGSRTGIRIY